MLNIMDSNRNAIEVEMGTLAFYMQGGLNLNHAYLLSAKQRRVLSKVIEKHYQQMSGKAGNIIG